MRKRLSVTLVMVLLFSLVLSACDLLPQPETDAFTVGMVTDVGGIDDRSFNATAWRGIELAQEELNVEGDFLESTTQADYAPNITHYINQDAGLIVTVGFLLADDTREFAVANPDVNFAIVDFAYDPPIDNIRGLVFATDEAGFLAGYAAAAATQTGIVATFGGINIPPVSIFMVGFESGVNYYNQQNGASVQVLGWNTAANTGVFVGNFDSTDDGRRVADEFLSEGADIIMPVAGPVGLGSAEAVQQAGNAWIIGVDTDWTVSAPEYASIILTSVLKNMDIAVFDTIEMAADPGFTGFGGETYLGTLENDGVGIAPIASGAISPQVQSELDQIRQAIINGEIDTGWGAFIGGLN
jgi:basic membrane protein A and related proteins